MEASVAATDGAAAEAGAEQGTQQDTGGGLDLSPVLQRFDDLGGRMERIEQSFASKLGGEESAEGEGEDGYDFAELFGAEEEGQQGLDPKALQQLVDARSQAAIEAAMAPLLEQVQGIQVGLDAEQLTAKYPPLADPAVSGPVVEQARTLAEAVGKPELVHNMQFIETIYKAQMADKYAAGEKPVGAEQGFDLERGRGAGPAAPAEGPNIAERIIARRQNADVWQGWQ